ncbi:MAG TPA: glycosyltransferase family 2 protein [Herpetosiphonaceae bacterium]|nr:glycosyltransferase family 2 protein [Herpetosiphonaceae bacterium]
MNHLAIVILNYNSADVLRPCLESLRGQTFAGRVDVWVVDNASADDSVAMVRRDFPEVSLIAAERNDGFSAGNNLALRRILASDDPPEAVLILNPDTVVPPDGLAGLARSLDERPAAGVIGPKLVLEDGSLDMACRRSFPSAEVALYRMTGLSRLFPRSRRFGRYNLTYLDPDQITEVDSVVGAAMLVRTGVIREVGMFDETFFMYGEDLDWCFRIKSYGWQVWYDPRVTILHYKRVSSTRRAVPSIRAFYEAMRIFHRKHYESSTVAPLNWLIYLGITLKEWQALARNRLRPTRSRPMA